MRKLGAAIAVASLVAACVFSKADDGASCSDDKDCKSVKCFQGACAGSGCSSESDTSTCLAGWKCLHYDADPITGFFGNTGDFTCTATCGHCTAGHYCAAGGVDGETACTFGTEPFTVALVATPAASKVGDAVHFAATVTPAGDPPKSVTWHFGDVPDQVTTTLSIDHTFTAAGSLMINVQVENAAGAMTDTSISFVVSGS